MTSLTSSVPPSPAPVQQQQQQQSLSLNPNSSSSSSSSSASTGTMPLSTGVSVSVAPASTTVAAVGANPGVQLPVATNKDLPCCDCATAFKVVGIFLGFVGAAAATLVLLGAFDATMAATIAAYPLAAVVLTGSFGVVTAVAGTALGCLAIYLLGTFFTQKNLGLHEEIMAADGRTKIRKPVDVEVANKRVADARIALVERNEFATRLVAAEAEIVRLTNRLNPTGQPATQSSTLPAPSSLPLPQQSTLLMVPNSSSSSLSSVQPALTAEQLQYQQFLAFQQMQTAQAAAGTNTNTTGVV